MELLNNTDDEYTVECQITPQALNEYNVEYNVIYQRVTDFTTHRTGMYRDPLSVKGKKSFNERYNQKMIGDIVGGLCQRAFLGGYTTSDVVTFLDDVQHHIITEVPENRVVELDEIISDKVLSHPFYYQVEPFLAHLRPGAAQVGPCEFLFCFYDSSSRYEVDATSGYDIILTPEQHKIELKRDGTKLTVSPEKLAEYKEAKENEELDKFMMVLPVSNKSLSPQKRTRFLNIDFRRVEWNDYLMFTEVKEPGLKIKRELL